MELATVIVLIVGLLLCIAMGVPIVMAMVILSALVVLAFDEGSVNAMVGVPFGSVNSYTLIAIPLFILVGTLMTSSGMATDMVALVARAFGKRQKGSSGYITVGASLFFAGVSGSSTADTAALATVMGKSLEKDGYSRGYIGAPTSVDGGLGLIIPPSIMLVIFGVVAQVSVGDLFFAGIILTLTLALVVTWENRKVKKAEAARVAAAAAVAYILIVWAIFYRDSPISRVYVALRESASLTSMIMILTAAGGLFAWVIVKLGVAQMVGDLLDPLAETPLLLTIVILLILPVGGMFIEPVPLIYLSVPVFLPVLTYAHVDMIHFGVLFTMLLCLAQVTPPVGANLFVASGVLRILLEQIVRKLRVPLLSIFAAIIIVLLIPQLATWLPSVLK